MLKIRVLVILVLAGLGGSSDLAAAVEGEEAGWGWWFDGIGRAVNLLILFGIIYYFAREPLKNFFLKRRADIQREIRESRQAQAEAEKKLASIEERLKNLDSELAAMRAEAEREAALERRRILEEAERDAEKILSMARREITVLTRAAQKKLKEDAAQLSVELAEEQIRKEMTEQDEHRVVDRFFVKLSGGSESKLK